MTIFERLLMGGAQFLYAPADDNGGGEGGGSDDGSESGEEGADDGADGGENGGSESGEGDEGGKDKKDSDSLLNALKDGEGQTFDFTTGEKPEGFPDKYWDADKKGVNAQAIFDDLTTAEKRASDLRAKMGKGAHKPPEKPEGYAFKPSDKAAPFIKDGDPLVAASQKIAHKYGLSQEAYSGFMADMVEQMATMAGEMADENSPANEEARKTYIAEQIKAIGPNGPQVLRAVQSWGRELVADGTLSEADVETLEQEGLTSAKMVQLFNRLRSRMGGGEVPMQAIDDGLPPDSEIADLIDKAYASKDPKKIREAEAVLDKRRAAGRPERLQF
nr:MAG TPA: hypothetical protein [Caudoviricetes sp.]